VIGVTADGNLGMKSFYSSYGVGAVQVTAPGGDSILQKNPPSNPLGRVLSTWPSGLVANCLPARRVFEGTTLYCYQQVTSMAPLPAGCHDGALKSRWRIAPHSHTKPTSSRGRASLPP